ncbi:MAG: CPBP family intramembrane glutamic endopeptidase [Thermodesulfobacteriota bacterium]
MGAIQTIGAVWRGLFAETWRQTDERYLPQGRKYRRHIVPVGVTAALALTVHEYFGFEQTFKQLTWLRLGGEYAGFSYYAYWSAFNILALVLIPLIYIKFFTPFTLKEIGLGFSFKARHWGWYLGLYLAVLPPVAAASFLPSFIKTYPACDEALRSIKHFAIWELIYAAQFFAVEFFYRGFMVHALKYSLGAAAVTVMVVPYCMFHFGKPLPECLGSIVAGLVLGSLSLKIGNIWGGVALHSAVAMSMDILALIQRKFQVLS